MAIALYLVAALALALTPRDARQAWRQWLLVAGLLASAVLPSSHASEPALALRLLVALGLLVLVAWRLRQRVSQASVAYLLGIALIVLLLCGAGFWWLEPSTPTLVGGLWLAFTTAATVGYGDVVPTTTASRIFSVFVVLLGYGLLSVVTAAIAAVWIETEERRIEREILHDLHHQLGSLRAEVSALRADLKRAASEREPM